VVVSVLAPKVEEDDESDLDGAAEPEVLTAKAGEDDSGKS
jgi:hypothetical protein